ncbi:histidinol dehydrogenase, partial [Oleiphilus sp. HI0043]
MVDIKRLSSTDDNFEAAVKQLVAWDDQLDHDVHATVKTILDDVKSTGDDALVKYTSKFDGLSVGSASELEIPKARLMEALQSLPTDQKQALEISAQRVKGYHEKQNQGSWDFTEVDGTRLGQRVVPLDKAGLYVPGGKAAYPSSVLMNAIPAKVAGVPEVIMVVPTPKGEVNELVLAAAALSGVDRVFTIGGAQAVAALAYGT